MINRRSILAGGGAAAAFGVLASTTAGGPAEAGEPVEAALTQHEPDNRIVHVIQPEGVAPGKGYSQVVWGSGRFVAVAGQVGVDATGALVGPGDPTAQARQAFENLRLCLRAAGAGFDDVLSLTIYVTDVAHLPAIRAVRDAVIDTARPPASTAVQVVALALPGLLLEIEASALAGGNGH